MAYLLGVLVIAFGVAASIALHEIGHLVPAKRFGVKCTQYMVGFGPTIWSRRRGETEYGLKAIPLGGYVRMVGMFPPAPGRPARADTTGRWSLMIEQARTEAQREVRSGGLRPPLLHALGAQAARHHARRAGHEPGDRRRPARRSRSPASASRTRRRGCRASPSACCPLDAPADQKCTAADRAAPAAAAGLKPGDTIVSFDGAADRRLGGRARRDPRQPGAAGRRSSSSGTAPAGPSPSRPILDDRPVFDADGNPVVGSDGQAGHGEGRLPRRHAHAATSCRSRSARCPGVHRDGARADRRRRHPHPGEDGRRREGGVRQRRARPQRARSASSASAGSPARSRAPRARRWSAQPRGPVRAAPAAARLAEPRAVRLQPDPAAAAGRRARGRGALGGHAAAVRAAALAARTPGRSTSPGRCRSPTASRPLLIGMSVLLIYADIVRPIRLGG